MYENIEQSRKDIIYMAVRYSDNKQTIVKCSYNVLLYCERGNAIVEINYRKYNIEPRTTLLLRFQDVLSCIYVSRDFQGQCIAFVPSLITFEISKYDYSFLSVLFQKRIMKWSSSYSDYIEQIFMTIRHCHELNDYELFKKTALALYFCYLNMLQFYFKKNNMINEEQQINVSNKKDYFNAFVKELFYSYRKSREVLYYANVLNISSNYLNEVCQSTCKHSAKEIIDFYISSQLKFELCNSDKSMQQLAEEFNFPNQSYLSRYYRRIMQETPSETRRNRTSNNFLFF